jgi:hypothetical protein
LPDPIDVFRDDRIIDEFRGTLNFLRQPLAQRDFLLQ